MKNDKVKFTPGPWKQQVNNTKWKNCQISLLSNDLRLCIANVPYITDDDIPTDEAKANALLIAAAPEMYEAMNEFCERVEKGEVRSTKTYNKFKEILKKINDE
jgi:hypothetical protein